MSVGTGGAKVALTNTNWLTADDALQFEVTVDGIRRYLWTPVTVAKGDTVIAYIRFLQPVTSPVITLCGNKPVGIVESPDPIAGIVVTPPPPDTEP